MWKQPSQFARRYWVGAVVLWIALVAVGFAGLTLFSETPGSAGPSPVKWPPGSIVPAPRNKPLMIIALHPKCACSRATVAELNRLLVSVRGKVDVHALMMV